MRRMSLLFLSLCLIAIPAFAEMEHHKDDPFAMEMESILSQYRDRSPASLTFGEMEEISALLSVPAQKAAYVKKSAMMSYMMPGAGQFMNGDAGAGALFLAADLAVAAGTLVGIHFLLPEELRYDQLDYLNTPPADIHAAWEAAAASTTFMDALPILGVTTGSMILKQVLSSWSAHHAAELAMGRIRSGELEFKPRAEFFLGRHGMGIGFGMKY